MTVDVVAEQLTLWDDLRICEHVVPGRALWGTCGECGRLVWRPRRRRR